MPCSQNSGNGNVFAINNYEGLTGCTVCGLHEHTILRSYKVRDLKTQAIKQPVYFLYDKNAMAHQYLMTKILAIKATKQYWVA